MIITFILLHVQNGSFYELNYYFRFVNDVSTVNLRIIQIFLTSEDDSRAERVKYIDNGRRLERDNTHCPPCVQSD